MEEGVLQVHVGWASWEVCHLKNESIILFRWTTKTIIIKQTLFLENFCSKLLHPLFGHHFLEIWDIQLQIHCLHWQTLDISKCGIVVAAVLEVHTVLCSRWWSFGQGWSVFNWALDTSVADAGHTLRTLVSRCRRRMILVEGPRGEERLLGWLSVLVTQCKGKQCFSLPGKSRWGCCTCGLVIQTENNILATVSPCVLQEDTSFQSHGWVACTLWRLGQLGKWIQRNRLKRSAPDMLPTLKTHTAMLRGATHKIGPHARWKQTIHSLSLQSV